MPPACSRPETGAPFPAGACADPAPEIALPVPECTRARAWGSATFAVFLATCGLSDWEFPGWAWAVPGLIGVGISLEQATLGLSRVHAGGVWRRGAGDCALGIACAVVFPLVFLLREVSALPGRTTAAVLLGLFVTGVWTAVFVQCLRRGGAEHPSAGLELRGMGKPLWLLSLLASGAAGAIPGWQSLRAGDGQPLFFLLVLLGPAAYARTVPRGSGMAHDPVSHLRRPLLAEFGGWFRARWREGGEAGGTRPGQEPVRRPARLDVLSRRVWTELGEHALTLVAVTSLAGLLNRTTSPRYPWWKWVLGTWVVLYGVHVGMAVRRWLLYRRLIEERRAAASGPAASRLVIELEPRICWTAIFSFLAGTAGGFAVLGLFGLAAVAVGSGSRFHVPMASADALLLLEILAAMTLSFAALPLGLGLLAYRKISRGEGLLRGRVLAAVGICAGLVQAAAGAGGLLLVSVLKVP